MLILSSVNKFFITELKSLEHCKSHFVKLTWYSIIQTSITETIKAQKLFIFLSPSLPSSKILKETYIKIKKHSLLKIKIEFLQKQDSYFC